LNLKAPASAGAFLFVDLAMSLYGQGGHALALRRCPLANEKQTLP
jgi:hypothetical protein